MWFLFKTWCWTRREKRGNVRRWIRTGRRKEVRQGRCFEDSDFHRERESAIFSFIQQVRSCACTLKTFVPFRSCTEDVWMFEWRRCFPPDVDVLRSACKRRPTKWTKPCPTPSDRRRTRTKLPVCKTRKYRRKIKSVIFFRLSYNVIITNFDEKDKSKGNKFGLNLDIRPWLGTHAHAQVYTCTRYIRVRWRLFRKHKRISVEQTLELKSEENNQVNIPNWSVSRDGCVGWRVDRLKEREQRRVEGGRKKKKGKKEWGKEKKPSSLAIKRPLPAQHPLPTAISCNSE